MKKTIFLSFLTFSLLDTSLAQAQQTSDFIIPANSYTLSSSVGVFTDIADLEGTVKLGGDLPAGTALKDGFFVNAKPSEPAAADNFVIHTADKTKTDPGFDLGFTFNFCGKKMTHFTICASGGIHFGTTDGIPQAQSSAWFTLSQDFQNLVTLTIWGPDGTQNPMLSIADKTPAMYLIDGEDGQKVLTVQYDYAVNGDEWIYQIKVYEENGHIEFIADDLKFPNLGDKQYRMFFGLVENGNSSIPNDQLKTLNLLASGNTHRIGFNQTTAAGWDQFAAYTSSTIGNGLIINTDNKPKAGQTLTFAAPNACKEKAAPITPDSYSLSFTSITKNSFNGKISFNGAQSKEELAATGTLVAVLSKSQTPDFILSNGTWYQKEALIDNTENQILLNQKPSYNAYVDKPVFGDVAISADNLTAGTPYYIHIYTMDYKCLGAPVYSDLCHTFSFTSSIDLPQKLSAGLPTPTSVPVTVQSAGEGFGVVLFKSPNTTPLSLNGKLQEGDSVGNAKVLTVINSATETHFDAPFEAGEGAYILAVSATNLDSDEPTYATDFLSVPVRAAYDGLPTFEFSQETVTYPKPDEYPNLPFGWSRETELPATLRSYAFGISGGNGDPICLSSSYVPETTDWIDAVTPAFVNHKSDIQATFQVSYLKAAQQGDPTRYNAGQTDEIRIEYAINGGEWTTAAQLNGSDALFPTADAQGHYAISVNLRKIATESTIRLRYSYKSPSGDALILHRIHKVEIVEGRECMRPAGVTCVDSLTTDGNLTLRWLDNNYPLAANSVIAYRQATGTDTAWQYRRIATPNNHPMGTPLDALIPNLDAATLYIVKVAAICDIRDTSFYTQENTARTAFSLPYEESMAQSGNAATAQTPFDRGVRTYTGPIGGTLTETTDAGWNQTMTSDSYNRAISVSIGDFTTNAWLMLPDIFIAETGNFTPKSIRFTLSSFNADKQKGVRPDYDDTKLHVLASKNGIFTRNSIIKTLNADDLALNDAALSIDLSEREGRLQIAFVFECPSAIREDLSEETGEKEPWYLEISQLSIAYDVDVCFPVSRLRRSLGVDEIPVSWEAAASAVEYGVFWGLESEDGYTDTAYTAETRYTITGLEEQTRYRIMVIAYCSADRQLYSEPATTEVTTLLGCHTPTDFAVSHITLTGADFSSKSDQPDYMNLRLVYVWTEADDNMRVFRQMTDTLSLQDSLTERTAYLAATRAVCGTDTSAMSEEIRFVTENTATEPTAQINTQFNVRTQDGRIIIRNLNGLLIKQVSVYNLNGLKLADYRTDSRDDLALPVDARHALLFVRLQSEKGIAIYKTYLQ